MWDRLDTGLVQMVRHKIRGTPLECIEQHRLKLLRYMRQGRTWIRGGVPIAVSWKGPPIDTHDNHATTFG